MNIRFFGFRLAAGIVCAVGFCGIARGEGVTCVTGDYLGVYDTGGEAVAIEAAGDTAYVLDEADGLIVLDVSQPGSPVLLGSLPLSGELRNICIDGDTAYVAAGSAKVLIIDVSDPQQPVQVGVIPVDDSWDMKIRSDIAYVASGDGLFAFDVSDPLSPDELFGFVSSFAAGRSIELNGTNVIVAGAGFSAFDLSDLESPEFLGFHGFPSLFALDVAVHDGVAYFVTQGNGVEYWDVSDLHAPVRLGAVEDPGYGSAITIEGATAYVTNYVMGDGTRGLTILDLGTPGAPIRVGFYQSAGNVYQTAVTNGVAFSAGSSGVEVFDVSDPKIGPVLASLPIDLAVGREVSVCGSVAVVGDVGSIFTVDVADPTNPSVLDRFDGGESFHVVAVACDGAVAYAGGFVGLHTLDISDPTDIKLLGTADLIVFDLCVADSLVFVGGDGLTVFDASDPSAPAQIGHLPTDDFVHTVTVDGATAYLSFQNSEICIVDITDPSTPAVIGSMTVDESVRTITADEQILVIDVQSELRIMDVSDPASPKPASSVLPELIAFESVHLSGDRLVAVEGLGDVVLVDITDAYAPVEYGRVPLWGQSVALDVVGDTAFSLRPSPANLLVIDLSDCLSCPADLTTTNAPPGSAGYGVPDGLVTAADIQFYVNAWVAQDTPADLTTQNAPVGDPAYGVPDGLVTAIDLQYYVNLWLAGCP